MLVLATTLVSTTVCAEVYKWVDERGVTHYSETAPDTGTARKLNVAPPPSEESRAEALERANKESIEAGRAEVERRRLSDLQRDADAAARRRKDVQEMHCNQARQQLAVLTRGGPVYRRNSMGERVYLEDNQRDAEIGRLQREVQASCSASEDGYIRPEAVQPARQDAVLELCLQARERLAELQQPSMRSSPTDIRQAQEVVNRFCGPRP